MSLSLRGHSLLVIYTLCMIKTLITEIYTTPQTATVECIVNGGMRTITFGNNLSTYRQYIPKIIHCLSVLGVKTQLKKIHFSILTDKYRLLSPYYLPALIFSAYTKILKRNNTNDLLLHGNIDHEIGQYTQSEYIKSFINLIPTRHYVVKNTLLNNTPLPFEMNSPNNAITLNNPHHTFYYISDKEQIIDAISAELQMPLTILHWIKSFAFINPDCLAKEGMFIVTPDIFPNLLKFPPAIACLCTLTIYFSLDIHSMDIPLFSKILTLFPKIILLLQQKQQSFEFKIQTKRQSINTFIIQTHWDQLFIQRKTKLKEITSSHLKRMLTL